MVLFFGHVFSVAPLRKFSADALGEWGAKLPFAQFCCLQNSCKVATRLLKNDVLRIKHHKLKIKLV